MEKDKLYYDGMCSLCVTEMDRLGHLADSGLDLVDIHSLTDFEGVPDKETLLGTLHLQSAEGEMLVGMDANVAAWQHTRFGLLWRPLRWPVIKKVVDIFYRHWARWRYRRLYGRNPEGV